LIAQAPLFDPGRAYATEGRSIKKAQATNRPIATSWLMFEMPAQNLLPARPTGAYSVPMPTARTIVKYAIDALMIFAPLAGVIYFLFDPAAFNTFLDWLVRVL
jgi:hypothetical protein